MTAPADRTAARRATRAETEQAARRGWAEAPRVTLRREVCTAAAGARTEQEFFARLDQAGVLVRQRYSTIQPGEVTGYAVGLPQHTASDGGSDLVRRREARRRSDPAETARPVGHARRGCPAPGSPAPGGAGRAPAHGDRRSGSRRGMRRGSSPGCGRRACWCGCGSARSIRARSPATPSRSPATSARTGRRCGTAAGGWQRS